MLQCTWIVPLAFAQQAQSCSASHNEDILRDVHYAFSNLPTSMKNIMTNLREDDEDEEECFFAPITPIRTLLDVEKACNDVSAADDNDDGDSRRGWMVYAFFKGLANSETFKQSYWHKRPLLIRSKDTGGWMEGFFTVERDLRLVEGSYITGYKTADVLRNGTRTDTWQLAPLKDNNELTTTFQQVQDALDGGTIYFNTAGSLWPNLGGFCRLTAYAFGLPPNVNVYVTPPGCKLSVPPHTDKQDVFVFQTQGQKRWRIYAPPPRQTNNKSNQTVDPLNRGKGGDVLSFDELGVPLLDIVVKPGDFLYVPTGFPHTTDTTLITTTETSSTGTDAIIAKKEREESEQTYSFHLTMGLDTHVWCLTMAHLRWTLLQRCHKAWKLQIEDDDKYWNAMETIPIGFLANNRKAWRATVRLMNQEKGEIGDDYRREVVEQLKEILVDLEPNRWKTTNSVRTPNGDESQDGKEELPCEEEMNQVVDYFVGKHWRSLMDTQESMFDNVNPKSEETLVKAFQGMQQHNIIMEQFGEFSNNPAFAKSFAQKRIAAEHRAKGHMV